MNVGCGFDCKWPKSTKNEPKLKEIVIFEFRIVHFSAKMVESDWFFAKIKFSFEIILLEKHSLKVKNLLKILNLWFLKNISVIFSGGEIIISRRIKVNRKYLFRT